MDYRGLSVIGVWAGAIGVSAMFLLFDFTTDFIMAMILAAVVLTVYIVRLKPGGEISDEVDRIVQALSELKERMAMLEKNVEEINKLLED